MVVTLCGCYERTYPLFSQASLFVWHDGACTVIWRIAIILPSLLCCCKLETTFCFSLTLLVPVFFSFSFQLTNFLPFLFYFYHFVMLDLHGQGFGSFVCWRVGICQLALSLWANCTVEPFIAAGLCAEEVDAVIVFLMT